MSKSDRITDVDKLTDVRTISEVRPLVFEGLRDRYHALRQTKGELCWGQKAPSTRSYRRVVKPCGRGVWEDW